MAQYNHGINKLWSTEWLLIKDFDKKISIVELIEYNFWDPQFSHTDNSWFVETTNDDLQPNQEIPISNFAQWHFSLYLPAKPITISLYEPRQWIELVSAPKGRTYLNSECYTLDDGDALLIPSWIYHSIKNSNEQQTLVNINARLRIGHYDWTGIVPR